MASRYEKRLKNKVAKIVIAFCVGGLIYYWGYTNGQVSVYEKARNDAEFQKQVWGSH